MDDYIRVIDFSAYSLGTENIAEADLEALTQELMHSFTTSGFAYLKNTGITQQEIQNPRLFVASEKWSFDYAGYSSLSNLIFNAFFCRPSYNQPPERVCTRQAKVDEMFDVNDRFYDLPVEIKEKYARAEDTSRERHGWACIERESCRAGHLFEHVRAHQARRTCLQRDLYRIHHGVFRIARGTSPTARRIRPDGRRLEGDPIRGRVGTEGFPRTIVDWNSLSGLSGVDRPGDLKEYFGIKIPITDDESWPFEVPEFEETCLNFYAACKTLTFRMLELIARGLGIEVAGFLDMFKHMGTGPNGTNLRSLRYPPVPDVVKKNQLRCAEHTDLGCITLLFQDKPGLEVSTGEDFVSAPPIPGTVVVNIGDMLQRWTADKLVSTIHRVMIPETAEGRGEGRRSIAFFAHADSDVQLKCLDGSDKYEPMIARDYVKQKLNTTYL
ncbi:hypothetical protein Bbelb_105260 [Branchiostoma belcheri]|nr:hypothetical protein Bbelb_105260 [Branchiostoma belcheri]